VTQPKRNRSGRITCNRYIVIVVVVLLTVSSARTLAQTADDEVSSYVEKLEAGKIDEVKAILPELAAKYQNHPGVLYLQGRTASDGIEAVKAYQSIVDNFPRSQWAADALYRTYQYYYSLGLYRTADLKLQQLKREYPNSPYGTDGPPAPTPKQAEEVVNVPQKETKASDAAAADSVIDERAPATQEPYTLQVGAFSTSANAEKQKDFFEERGYRVEITNKVRGGRSLYLVWVGSFRTAEEAMRFGKEVKSKYKFDSIVVERY
jgi:cell division septation protein DedD